MSWAAHDPEKYDEIIRKGINRYLDKVLEKHSILHAHEYSDAYEVLVEIIQADSTLKSLYDDLRTRAHKQIEDAEQDYFSDQWSRMCTHD